jgi:acetoin utilization deacetylase AcuC-like enzyme
VTTGGFGRIGAALAAPGRPTVVVQEGGYAIEALGANAVALLQGLQEPG